MYDETALPKVIEELGRAFAEFRDMHERELREIKSGLKAAPVDYEKIDRALHDLQEKKDRIELAMAAQKKQLDELERRVARPALSGEGDSLEKETKMFQAALGHKRQVDTEQYRNYRAAFPAFLRKNTPVLSETETKALQVGVDPDGGYLVPPDMSGRIVTRVFELSPMRQIASVTTISTDALEGVIDTNDISGAGWVGETASRPATDTPTLGRWRIPVHEQYAMPEATQQILDDAAVDVEAWLQSKLADRFARVEAQAFITGDGVGKPRGICSYPTATTGDDARAWGTFQHVNTGVNGDFAATTPADILFDLIGAFKSAYLQNAVWLTRREVITRIRKFKESTTNAYIWQPGLQQGQPQTLLGYPVVIAQDMPALGTGSLSLAFGDFREAYQIVDRIGIRTLRDPYTNKPYVRFYTTRRVGGAALQFEAVKFIRFGT